MDRSVLFLLVWSLYISSAFAVKLTFTLFNRNNPNGIAVDPNDDEWKLRCAFIDDIDVKFIGYGWQEGSKPISEAPIRTAYETMSDHNLVIAEWASKGDYLLLGFNAATLGQTIGNMVIRLIKLQLTTLDRVHLIGHSIGAHLMGIAGGHVRDSGLGKVARVTGLDPSRIFYEGLKAPNDRLDDNDAQFVDAIHTSAGLFGYLGPIGHADFFPNGGVPQQYGCTSIFDLYCGHRRSIEYFIQSILHEEAFPATKCNSYANYQANSCKNGEVVHMGNPAPSSARGSYFLTTNFRL